MAPFWFLNHGSDLCVRCGRLVGNNQAHSCACRWPLRVDRDTRWYICWKDLLDNRATTAVRPVGFWKPGASATVASLATQDERYNNEHVAAVMPLVSRTPSPCFDWEPPRGAVAAGSSSMSDAASLMAFLQSPVQGELEEQSLPSVASPAVSCTLYRSLGVSPVRSSESLTWSRPCPMILNICMTNILELSGQERASAARVGADVMFSSTIACQIQERLLMIRCLVFSTNHACDEHGNDILQPART